MTSYALTHSESFRIGMAGGTVADWRNYDSIYRALYADAAQSGGLQEKLAHHRC